MATFQDMARDNPNIRAPYDEWRQQRAAQNEDWVGEDYKQAHPDWDAGRT